MPVQSFRELGRSMEGAIDSPTTARRRFVVILGDDALQKDEKNLDVINALGGGLWGTPHPEFAFLKLKKFTLNETFGDNPYHVEAILEYGLVTANQMLPPVAQPPVTQARKPEWIYESVAGEQVPALFYYNGSSLAPLTNSAYDYFEGLTVPESLTRVTIRQNFQSRPDAIISSFGNVNSDAWAGAAVHHCKHEGSKVEQVFELWGNVEYVYWRVESQILFRPTGWNLQLPDVGFNYLGENGKQRAMVFDNENGEWIPSPNPVALNGGGGPAGGAPAILERRVMPETAFQPLFGAPPT